jgi:hypothetical protein
LDDNIIILKQGGIMSKKSIILLSFSILLIVSLGWACGEVEVYPSGSVEGWILNADYTDINDRGITGATITITYTAGIDDKVGESWIATSGIFDGNFKFYDVPAGTYEITVDAAGYYGIGTDGNNPETFTLEANEAKVMAAIALPDETAFNAPEVRAILTWNNSTDIDIHVTYPEPNHGYDPYYVWDNNREHIYYSNKTGNCEAGATDCVELLKDFNNVNMNPSPAGLGPEVVKFRFNDSAPDGIYMITAYGWEDVTVSDPEDAEQLGLSNATIRFCDSNNGCFLNYVVPTGAVGNQWVAAYFDWCYDAGGSCPDGAAMAEGYPYIYGYDMGYLRGTGEDDITNFDLIAK